MFKYLFLLFVTCNSLKNLFKTTTYFRKINKNEIKVIEPINLKKENIYSVIYLTGGNNFIQDDIYCDFLTTLASHKFSVNLIHGNFNEYDKLVDDLDDTYKGVIVAQHSSSSILLANICENCTKIKKAIFLDPVDSRIFYKKYWHQPKIKLPYLKNILFLNAAKSYKWSLKPFGIPFIPFFSIKKETLDTNIKCKINKIVASNYGHCDILDKSWSDLMHNSRLALGNQNRTYHANHDYHEWLSQVFFYYSYYNLNKLGKNLTINYTIE